MSVRARLELTVVALIVVAVLVLGAISYFSIDHALRSSFRSQLDTLVRAAADQVDVKHGRVSLDQSDLVQIANLHPGLPYALFDRNDVRVLGDLLPSPLQRGGLMLVTAPVRYRGVVVGSVAAWEPDAWIGALDRDVVLATVALGAVLVGIGALVSRRIAESFDVMLERVQASVERERRFAADASHELRTPLAVIKAECDLALRRDREPEEYRQAIASVAREAGRLEELTSQLLAAARFEGGAREAQVVDVNHLVRMLAERVRPAAEVREVRVTVSTNGEAFVQANATNVERALLAVLHNAIDHAKPNGAVELRVAENDGTILIAVADDGTGFSAGALQHATERFWRGNPSRSRGGTGLGLAIARATVEANGGSIRIQNRAEGGALVTLSLPRAAS
jgi:signal transduction histidine kinase